MMNAADLNDTQLDRQIKLRFETSNLIETLLAHLTACGVTPPVELDRALMHQNADLVRELTDLVSERAYREGMLRPACKKAA